MLINLGLFFFCWSVFLLKSHNWRPKKDWFVLPPLPDQVIEDMGVGSIWAHSKLPFWMASVQFRSSVVSDSLQPQRLQHTRPPCPSLTPVAYSNSCSLSLWWHPTISSSVIPFSSRPLSFPASESFQMSQLFASGGQSIGVSASASVLPMKTQDWFPLGWTGWIPLQSKELSRIFSNTSVQKRSSILQRSAFFIVQLSHPYMIIGKIIALIRWTFVGNVSAF